MYILNRKLKILKENLKLWKINVFGNIHDNLKNVEAKVDVV